MRSKPAHNPIISPIGCQDRSLSNIAICSAMSRSPATASAGIGSSIFEKSSAVRTRARAPRASLSHTVPSAGTDQGHDILAPRERPGDGKLCNADILGLGQGSQCFHKGQVLLQVLSLKARLVKWDTLGKLVDWICNKAMNLHWSAPRIKTLLGGTHA
jgi:hypothetical protein